MMMTMMMTVMMTVMMMLVMMSTEWLVIKELETSSTAPTYCY